MRTEGLDAHRTIRAGHGWQPIDRDAAVSALGAEGEALDALRALARDLRDTGKGRTVTYSRKAFFPVTNLCRDRCAYCTFRRDEGEDGAWTMRPDEIRAWAERAHDLDCIEALMCLGDQPEAAFPGYRAFLASRGHASTIGYVGEACRIALAAGLLPHSNPGVMSPDDLALLRPLNVSLGMMLESTSAVLRRKGHAHYYAPDKDPDLRLQVLRDAGEQRIPFTTGILIGIGESPADRVDSLLAIADLHQRYGHVQEVIVQNFRAKPEIPMATCEEPDTVDLARTVAVARLILGPEVNVQVPPNLSPEGLAYLLDSGINDLGGISPLTPDYVNPEAPWPHLAALARDCARAGYRLAERLPIYPEYVDRPGFLDDGLRERVIAAQAAIDARSTEGAAA
ncbi:MAG: 7,8-didemethyl-8-hydroxy-5-deazariboflavin synthase subunit CofG [Deltaproteobacteria bacterium]|nr:7,8-didemethyl-8-hydroxy-5-deazariboflavin synthase subunit CofG [Deltaproteobacteria bacterium]